MKRSDADSVLKWGAITVYSGAFLFLVCTSLAIYTYGSFNIFNQYLSELAVSKIPGMLFNTGLFVAGMLMVPFYLCLLEKYRESEQMGLAMLLGIISSISLITLGVFNLYYEIMHALAELVFFATANVSIVIASNVILADRHLTIGTFGFVIVPVNIVCYTMLPGPLSQKISVISILVWILIIITWLVLKEKESDMDTQNEALRKLIYRKTQSTS